MGTIMIDHTSSLRRRRRKGEKEEGRQPILIGGGC